MCTLAAGAMIMTAASGGYRALNQYRARRVQAKMYAYQESLIQQQQTLERQTAEQQSDLIRRTSERNIHETQGAAAEESKRLTRSIAVLTGAQIATMGAMGISGVTAADILKDTFDKSQLDQMAIKYNADIASWKYAEEAKSQIWSVQEEAKNRIWALGEEAKQYGYAAKHARKAGKIEAVGSLLETATSVAMIGAKYGSKARF